MPRSYVFVCLIIWYPSLEFWNFHHQRRCSRRAVNQHGPCSSKSKCWMRKGWMMDAVFAQRWIYSTKRLNLFFYVWQFIPCEADSRSIFWFMRQTPMSLRHPKTLRRTSWAWIGLRENLQYIGKSGFFIGKHRKTMVWSWPGKHCKPETHVCLPGKQWKHRKTSVFASNCAELSATSRTGTQPIFSVSLLDIPTMCASGHFWSWLVMDVTLW